MMTEYMLLVGASLLVAYVGAVLFAALGTFVCERILEHFEKRG